LELINIIKNELKTTTQEPVAYYQQYFKISEQIAKQDPQNSRAQRDLLVSYANLGVLYQKLKQNQLALQFFNQALPIAEKLAEDKINQQAQQDLKVVQNKLQALDKTR
jgi:tetratricopeptide (TPR) repeat protein